MRQVQPIGFTCFISTAQAPHCALPQSSPHFTVTVMPRQQGQCLLSCSLEAHQTSEARRTMKKVLPFKQSLINPTYFRRSGRCLSYSVTVAGQCLKQIIPEQSQNHGSTAAFHTRLVHVGQSRQNGKLHYRRSKSRDAGAAKIVRLAPSSDLLTVSE